MPPRAALAALILLLSRAARALGPTFGMARAGTPVCIAPSTLLNYTLPAGETHGVLHHFWTTGAAEKVDRMWVDYYIDGEATPSISFQPAMMCGLAFPAEVAHDFEFSAGALCGKTAPVGGYFNTFPIPFYASAVVAVRADAADAASCFTAYLNVRGTVALPLAVPGTAQALPRGARLRLASTPLTLRAPLDYVTLFSAPAGTRGQVFMTSWGVEAQPAGGPAEGGGYIEGCWNFYGSAAEPYPGLVVGTGVRAPRARPRPRAPAAPNQHARPSLCAGRGLL